MQRITISLHDDTARALDAHIVRYGYGNRLEAVRDLVREAEPAATWPRRTAGVASAC